MDILLLFVLGDHTPVRSREPFDLHLDDGTLESLETFINALRLLLVFLF